MFVVVVVVLSLRKPTSMFDSTSRCQGAIV